ncbi:MAG: hypothetical protein GY765_12570 [bacterium]|nr:hypothetical protein [bacterium]
MQYKADVEAKNPGMEVIQYYIKDSFDERKALYEYLQKNYVDKNIYYLFFIGRNAAVDTWLERRDANGELKVAQKSNGFSFYTAIMNNIYQFDPGKNRYIHTYLDSMTGGEIADPELQSTWGINGMREVSFGALVPTKMEFSPGKEEILAYFNKLHRFRTGEITFSPRVLFSDTMEGNTMLEPLVNGVSRWKNNVSLEVTEGNEGQWETEYLDYLSTQSFEICWLTTHGSPFAHNFGIYYSSIAEMQQLDTAVIVLNSCSNGDFHQSDYLAGTYLATGNVLAVRAFTEPVFVFSGAPEIYDFYPGKWCYHLGLGERIGDALRLHKANVLPTEVLFGDPLLRLSEPGECRLDIEGGGEEGSTEPSPGSYMFQKGTRVTINAVMEPHYELAAWGGDCPAGFERNLPLTFTLASDTRISPLFQRIIYPPLHCAGERVRNSSLFQSEYVDVLTWESNPLNIDIAAYRIYRIEGDELQLETRVDAATPGYWVRNVPKSESRTYKIVAVNTRNREGEAVMVTL